MIDMGANSGGIPACRDRPRVCPPICQPVRPSVNVIQSVDRIGMGLGQTRGLSLQAVDSLMGTSLKQNSRILLIF